MITFNPSKVTESFSLKLKGSYAANPNPRQQHELEYTVVEEQQQRDERDNNTKKDRRWGCSTNDEEELRDLDQQLRELVALVKQFENFIPKDLIVPSSHFISLKDFSRILETVKSKWESRSQSNKFAKAREYLRKVGSTIDNHSNALKILPSSNDYASIFCGALTVVIKASSNYERISECFCRAVAEINDAVTAVHEEVWAYRDEVAIQQLVARLYCQIFRFLINVMKWYTDKCHKRMLKSLNENIYEEYKLQIDDIRRLSDLIHKRATSRMLTEIKASTIEDARFRADLGNRDRDADTMRQEGYFERLRVVVHNEFRDTMEKSMDDIQQGISDRLLANVSHQIARKTPLQYLEQQAPELAPVVRPAALSMGAKPSAGLDDSCIGTAAICAPPTSPTRTSKDKIQLVSARLESFYDRNNISTHFESPDAFLLTNPSVAARIHPFTLASTSEVLHICGPMEHCEETHSALLAARFAASVRYSNTPTLSYFCQLSHTPVPEWRTRETVELVRLAYALIRQLVEVLPDGKEFDEERLGDAAFKALDGTLATWREAMELLRGLLEEVVEHHPLLYIVIDGISLLDDVSRHSTDRPLGELVRLLCERAAGRGGHLVKLLFTTAGESRALNASLEGSCTVKASI